jgi:trypsin-like peptidase/NACHT domain-containing protein/HEAT repeat protein
MNPPRHCVVRLGGLSGFRGTGFLVAPRTVLTCAHVAADGPDVVLPDGTRVAVEATRLVPADRGTGDYYAFPDLAILTLAGPADRPWLPLDTNDPAAGARVEVLGFSTSTPGPGVLPDSLLVTVAGESGGYVRVVGDQVVPGFSGSPVLDPATGLVVGMVKATRDPDGALGGWLVPVTALRETLEEYGPAVPRLVPDPPVLTPSMHDLFRTQRRTGAGTPYPLRVPNAPSLTSLYVRQRVQPPTDPTEEPAERAAPAVRDVAEVLREQRKCVVVGEPGIGKSTLVRHLAAASAGWWLAAVDSRATDPATAPYGLVVPVQLSARTLVGSSVRAAVAAVAGARPETRPVANVPDAEWLVLVDGLDEILVGDERRQVIAGLADELADTALPYRLVITSRPLPGRELTSLRVASTADYELCRFTHEDLADFARRWFATADEHAADHFLDQIDHARLGAIVTVPLLATIAATVFKVDDEQLPVSSYGLYDRFVSYLLQEPQPEVRTRQALRDRLGAFTARGEAIADWLFDERRALLAQLARHHLAGSSRPLHALAADYLHAHCPVPVPTGAVPDWTGLVTNLLLSTGVLVQHGEDVRFLHHSFAEFLAARAEAFRSAAGWVEEALDPARHHSAMFVLDLWARQPDTDADTLVAELARSGRTRAVLAGQILAAGVPVGAAIEETVVANLLRHLRNPNFADGDVTAVLRTLPSRRTVADGLRSLMTDRRGHKLCRIRAAELHAARTLGAVSDPAAGLAVLHEIAGDGIADAYSRTRAIEALIHLGEKSRWISTLRRIGAGSLTPAFVRRRTAEALVDAGEVAAGVGILRELATAVDQSASSRVIAATALAECGEEQTAIAVLRGLADAGDADPDTRVEAAQALLRVGDQHGLDVLRRLVSSAPPHLRPRVARELIDAGDRDQGTAVLNRIVGDHLGDLSVRVAAAGALADTGHGPAGRPTIRLAIRSRAGVAVRLARLSVPAAIDAATSRVSSLVVGDRDRALCAWRLAQLGEARLGLRTLCRLSTRKSTSDRDRIWAAQLLFDLGDTTAAAHTLRRVATRVPGAGPSVRTEAARTLAEYGEHQAGTDVLRAVVTDPATPAADRFSAATTLLDLGETDHGLDTLLELARGTDGAVRLHAARTLLERGQLDFSVAVLTELTHDRSLDPYVRLASATLLSDSWPPAEAQLVLVDLATTTVDDVGVIAAVRALIDRGFRVDATRLLRRLITDKLRLRGPLEEAIHLLSNVAGPEAARTLLQDLAVKGPAELRAWATELLVIAADSVEAGTALLLKLAKDDSIPDDDLWRAAAVLAECHGQEELDAFLRTLSTDPAISWFRQIGAAHQRVRLGNDLGLDRIVHSVTTASRLEDRTARQLYAIRLFESLPTSARTTAALAEVAKSKQHHPDVRARAMRVLADKDRGSAIDALNSILDDPDWSLLKLANTAALLAELGERGTALRKLREIVDRSDPQDRWRPEAQAILRAIRRQRASGRTDRQT